MTTSTRTTLSAATALGLVSFIASSTLFAGLFATPTLVAFSLLAVYGLVEIAILSYASPRVRPARANPIAIVPARAVRRVPAVVEYPAITRPVVCRACAA